MDIVQAYPAAISFLYSHQVHPGADRRVTDRGHTAPLNWFSNYLPDPDPCVFDPAAELYSSTDDRILTWQIRKMAEARIEVAIASWWGAGAQDRRRRPLYPHGLHGSCGQPVPEPALGDL